MKKIKSFMMISLICFSFVSLTKNIKKDNDLNAWVGVTYAMAENGATNEETAAVGVFGVFHAGMHGAIWGATVGGPAGAIAGIVVGL